MRRRQRVGIREMKDHASELIRTVQAGTAVTITDRGKPVALLVPFAARAPSAESLRALVAAGRIAWSGGKPRGLVDAPTVRGASVADAVVEDRR